jgi:hypothetical protein
MLGQSRQCDGLSHIFLVHRGGLGKMPGPLSFVRPAWAHSYGCKSRHKQVTASEAKRNCMRATECGEEAWIETAGR